MFNPYVILIAASVIFGAYVVGHSRGYSEADQRAQVVELQASLAAAQQDLAAEHAAAEMSRKAADENQQAAAAAAQRISDYEAELAKRGDAGRCALTSDDVRRMQRDGGPTSGQKPARR